MVSVSSFDNDVPIRPGHPKIGGRPYWQHTDCPKWCRQEHHNHDQPDNPGDGDRFHFSDSLGVDLTMEAPYGTVPGSPDVVPERFEVELYQGYREIEPHVTFGFRHGHFGVRLTLAEAEELSLILARMYEIANDSATWDETIAELAETVDGEQS
jgi:hypothetical protein